MVKLSFTLHTEYCENTHTARSNKFCDSVRCGHCKSLAPISISLRISCYHFKVRVVNFCKTNNVKPDYALFFLQTYEKVATAFKLEEDVVIANLDADKYKDLAEK